MDTGEIKKKRAKEPKFQGVEDMEFKDLPKDIQDSLNILHGKTETIFPQPEPEEPKPEFVEIDGKRFAKKGEVKRTPLFYENQVEVLDIAAAEGKKRYGEIMDMVAAKDSIWVFTEPVQRQIMYHDGKIVVVVVVSYAKYKMQEEQIMYEYGEIGKQNPPSEKLNMLPKQETADGP